MKTILIKGKYVYSVNEHEFQMIKDIMSKLHKAEMQDDDKSESNYFKLKLEFEERIQRTYKQPIMVIDYKV